MKIGIIDNDYCDNSVTHNFPNLALMKISAYHKNIGDDVYLTNFNAIDNTKLFNENYDKIYISKVFSKSKTPEFIHKMNNVVIGGSGFFYDKAEKLPYEIEHIMPDYSLYSENNIVNKNDIKYFNDYSIGFTTRGCIRQCDFCINRNEKTVYRHSPINEFLDLDKKYIMLLDDNITAYKYFDDVFNELNDIGKPFVFKQGMDIRLLNEKKINILLNSNYMNNMAFSFDNIKDKKIIVDKLELWWKIKPINSGQVMMYLLTGFDRNSIYDYSFYKSDFDDLLDRILICFNYKVFPYIMMHELIEKSPYFNIVKRLRRLLNQPIRLSNKTIEQVLIEGREKQIVEWLKENKYEKFLYSKIDTSKKSLINN